MTTRPSYIGVDLGGTKCLAIALDGSCRPLRDPLSLPTPQGGSEIVELLKEVIQGLGAHSNLLGVGVGVPGWVDNNRILRFAPNLIGATSLDLISELGRHFETRVIVENDANCAAWGEYQLGSGRGVQSMVLVTIGTGVGAGLILDGRLLRGVTGFAGEVGHMIVDAEGELCSCGRKGCWEVIASGKALQRLAIEAASAGSGLRTIDSAGRGVQLLRGEDVTAAARAKDPNAVALLGRYARYIAIGISNLANVLDPELFVIGGGLSQSGSVLFEPLETALKQLVPPIPERVPIKVVPAALGNLAGALGAGLIAAAATPP